MAFQDILTVLHIIYVKKNNFQVNKPTSQVQSAVVVYSVASFARMCVSLSVLYVMPPLHDPAYASDSGWPSN